MFVKKDSGSHLHPVENSESLVLHDHPCLIYDTLDELTEAFVPYLRSGLALTERCIYFIDENDEQFVVDAMQAGGFNLKPHLESGAFLIINTKDAHLKDGHFGESKMLSYWTEAVSEAHKAGFKGLRAAVEMTWALSGHPGCEILVPYESRLNNFTDHNPVTVICQYRRRKFTAEQIKGVIHAHPIVIANHEVLHNPSVIHPNEFIEGDAGLDVQAMLDNLTLANKLMATNIALETANKSLQEAFEAQKDAQAELKRLENERQRREVAEAKERQYRIIAEAIPQIVWTAKRDGTVDYLNGRWYQLTGMYPENSLGSGWLNIVHDDDRSECSQRWSESIASATPFEMPVRLRLANDEYCWMLYRALPIRDEENNIVKWFGTGTDIHEQKNLEIQLQQALSTEKTARKAAELANKEL